MEGSLERRSGELKGMKEMVWRWSWTRECHSRVCSYHFALALDVLNANLLRVDGGRFVTAVRVALAELNDEQLRLELQREPAHLDMRCARHDELNAGRCDLWPCCYYTTLAVQLSSLPFPSSKFCRERNC